MVFFTAGGVDVLVYVSGLSTLRSSCYDSSCGSRQALLCNLRYAAIMGSTTLARGGPSVSR